ncbi:hypothetical protein [Jiangella anatolica]|uniref:Uncharacterized protein n=1 Tax=Jiangella anatolica TaxID=2670374 RepID=A0A2W2C3D8_9ACTN|nr:hypothetical protein [Jiangella anatolica]PZF80296.1 hypothetical protein C1I92_26780 [Jiangella anatolica]
MGAFVRLAGLLAATGLVLGGIGERPPRLPPMEGGGGASLPDWPADTPWTMPDLGLCIDRPGEITLTGATLEHSDGLRLDAFAVREADWTGTRYPAPADGSGVATLEDYGFDPADRTIDTVCPADETDPDAPLMQLGLQFSKPSDATARGAVVALTYDSAGQSFVHRIWFELVLCEGPVDAAGCQPF